MSKYEEAIKKLFKEHNVVLFSKSYCGFCLKAKTALNAAGAKDGYFVMELDNRNDGSCYQEALFKLTKSRTVPQLFIRGKYVGGGTEAANLQSSGKLEKMIAATN